MSLELFYSPEFKKDYKRLTIKVQSILKQKGCLFREDPFHPTLRTHKLSGKLQGLWAFSIDFRTRIIFEFIGKQEVILHSVGDHSIYRDR